MAKTKVWGIESEDFFKFIKKINEFNEKHNVLATQTHVVNNKFYAVVYYNG